MRRTGEFCAKIKTASSKGGRNMKKVIFVMLIVCLLAACSPSSKKGPIEVSAAEVLEKLSDERQNSFLLYVLSDDCYSCD